MAVGALLRTPNVPRPSGGLLLLAVVVEVDGRGDREAGDHRPRRRAVEGDPDRHALRHLDPVAVGVLCREQRELASRSGPDALDVRVELLAAVSVNPDGRALPGRHAGKVLLLEV